MRRRLRRRVGKVVSPLFIGILKLHTAITGVQRSRVIVINEVGQLLLVRGFVGANWSLPGGGIEKGETPLHAAARELFEETGIKLMDEQFTKAGVLEGDQSPVNYVAHIYTTTIQSVDLPSKQYNTHEIIDVEWHDLAALPEDMSSIVLPSLQLLPK